MSRIAFMVRHSWVYEAGYIWLLSSFINIELLHRTQSFGWVFVNVGVIFAVYKVIMSGARLLQKDPACVRASKRWS